MVGHNTLLHRAIYETFKDVVLTRDVVINHKDHNRKNNNIDNLEQITQKLNSDDRADRDFITELPDNVIELPDNFAQRFYYLPTTKEVVRTQSDAEKIVN